jgi:hypothetical protein
MHINNANDQPDLCAGRLSCSRPRSSPVRLVLTRACFCLGDPYAAVLAAKWLGQWYADLGCDRSSCCCVTSVFVSQADATLYANAVVTGQCNGRQTTSFRAAVPVGLSWVAVDSGVAFVIEMTPDLKRMEVINSEYRECSASLTRGNTHASTHKHSFLSASFNLVYWMMQCRRNRRHRRHHQPSRTHPTQFHLEPSSVLLLVAWLPLLRPRATV